MNVSGLTFIQRKFLIHNPIHQKCLSYNSMHQVCGKNAYHTVSKNFNCMMSSFFINIFHQRNFQKSKNELKGVKIKQTVLMNFEKLIATNFEHFLEKFLTYNSFI